MTQDFTLTVTVPAPFIDIVSPTTATPGSTPSSLTIFGANFVSGSAVSFDGTSLTPASVTSNQIVIDSGFSTLPTAGVTLPVTVVNPNSLPLIGTSNVAFFPVTTATPSVNTSRHDYGVGTDPWSVAVADFRGNGKLDLAVANNSGVTVSILLGNGDGTFQGQVPYSTGNGPQSVAVGDFNGDGKLDLVVVNHTDNTVSILVGNGDGAFQSQTPYSAGHSPWAVAVGDFNGDGKLDLAVTNSTDKTVSILLGNGNGTFESPQTFPVGNDPVSVAVGDFNGDGKLDLVVVNGSDATVSILLGNGDGTFESQVTYSTGNYPASVAVGDFTGDGSLDLAVTNYDGGSGNTVSILLGKGNGIFQNQVTYPTGNGPQSVAVGDFNGDAKLDLAVANNQDSTVTILLGNGEGSFTANANSPSTGSGPFSIAVGDFNNDGRLDFATADVDATTATVLLQAPLGAAAPSTGLSFGNQPVNTTSGTMNATLTNNGSAALTITAVTASAGFGTTTNCVGTLQPGNQCTEQVTFKPTSTGATSGAVLTFTDNSGNVTGSTQTVPLSGNGIGAAATISKGFSPTSIPINGTSTLSFTIKNPNASLSLTGVTFSDVFPSGPQVSSVPNASNTCGGTFGIFFTGANATSLV